MAAMQRHLDAGVSIFRWWCRCCFITVLIARILFAAGWMKVCETRKWQELYAAAFPLIDITVVSDDIMQHRRIALELKTYPPARPAGWLNELLRCWRIYWLRCGRQLKRCLVSYDSARTYASFHHVYS